MDIPRYGTQKNPKHAVDSPDDAINNNQYSSPNSSGNNVSLNQTQRTSTLNIEGKQQRHTEQNAAHRESQRQINKNVTRSRELSSEHLRALKATFDKIIEEKFLSKAEYEEQTSIYNRVRDLIFAKRPDAQINLYGSSFLECCLKEKNIIDIDVQFNETLPYDTLIELIHIIRSWDCCKQAYIVIDNEPLSVDLLMHNSNISVRLTSNNIRAIRLCQIIKIYTEFDQRLLLLLRLFRIFGKICDIDQLDRGTFHPIVLHFMVIHFLQQLDPPVLPCLHEHVFGVDRVPVIVTSDQYAEFFRVCNEYAEQWKSNNTTNTEMLFLQLLSYYDQRFHATRFIISVQTRMPLLKDSNHMGTRKIVCTDPTSIERNLAYTMKATCMINYFLRIIQTGLNYFCRVPSCENKTENSNNLTNDDNEYMMRKKLVEIVHKSYKLFIERFSNRNNYWSKVNQEDVRQDYKKTFDEAENPVPEPKLKLNENNIRELLDEAGDDDNEREKNDSETIPSTDQIIDNQEIITLQNQPQAIDESFNETIEEEPISFKTFATDLDENQKAILRKEYAQQVRLFNDCMKQILNNIKSSTEPDSLVNEIEQTMTLYETSVLNYPEFFYDMKAENLDAEKGAPFICTICNQNNHEKSNCPTLYIPDIIPLPRANWQWINIISHVCQRITNECKPNEFDIKTRKQIVEHLQNECRKCFPSCHIYIYGSSNNGFGLRGSDLDVCIVLKDTNEQSNSIILEKLSDILRLDQNIFKGVELVRDARVPIIRTIHSQSNIEIDISLHNMLAIGNTRLLRTYAEIDPRVSQLGYMIKHLVKICDIANVKSGTLSSYAYSIMLIHFLQQIRPSVVPVLQKLNDDPSNKNIIRQCDKWNVYFYDDLSKLRYVWVNKDGFNTLLVGQLWIEFLRYYTEIFDYKNNVVSIRQIEPLRRVEKGWFRQTIAIEDPFILTHNLADQLTLQKWALIRRVLIKARQQFILPPRNPNILHNELWLQQYLFDVTILCPEYIQKLSRSNKTQHKKCVSNVNKQKFQQNTQVIKPLMQSFNN